MANTDIIGMLDLLYGMVTEAWSVPLGNDKCIIEREKAIEIINDIKVNLPTAIAEAQRLVAARDEFIGNAKREAEALRKNAEEQARQMIEEQEVMRVARAKSTEMISAADSKSKELRRLALEYVDDLMLHTEESMTQALSIMRTAHESFQAQGGAAPQAAAGQPAVQTARPAAVPARAQQQQRKPEVPAGKPDPLSAKIQRIEREQN